MVRGLSISGASLDCAGPLLHPIQRGDTRRCDLVVFAAVASARRAALAQPERYEPFVFHSVERGVEASQRHALPGSLLVPIADLTAVSLPVKQNCHQDCVPLAWHVFRHGDSWSGRIQYLPM